jgi:glycosyltransferase involved in cell wall biosynthesis
MHVAICADGVFPDSVGGMQRHTRLLVENLARRHPGLRLSVLHTHVGKRLFPGQSNVEEVEIAPRPNHRQYLLETYELSGRMADALRTMPDAIVYSQGMVVWKGIAEFAPRLIVNPHGLEAHQAFGWKDWLITLPFRRIFERIFRHSRYVVSLGGRLTDILHRLVPNPDQRVVVLPNGVVPPAEATADRDRRSGRLEALFVGRFAPNKGIPDLLAAMDVLNARGLADRIHVRLVGSGPLYATLKQANDRPNVEFLGSVDDAALDALYARSHVFVLPTLFEGMPTVVLEAMARGLPIIVTDVGATRELVDAENGVIIRKHDPADLAARLEAFAMMSGSERVKLGRASQAKITNRFTWDRVADAHYGLFERLAAERAVRGGSQ